MRDKVTSLRDTLEDRQQELRHEKMRVRGWWGVLLIAVLGEIAFIVAAILTTAYGGDGGGYVAGAILWPFLPMMGLVIWRTGASFNVPRYKRYVVAAERELRDALAARRCAHCDFTFSEGEEPLTDGRGRTVHALCYIQILEKS